MQSHLSHKWAWLSDKTIIISNAIATTSSRGSCSSSSAVAPGPDLARCSCRLDLTAVFDGEMLRRRQRWKTT